MDLFARHAVTAERHDPWKDGKEMLPANVEISTTLPDGLSDDARARIQTVLNREAERLAQIAAVDLRDRAVARDEAAHLATVPAQRPVTVVTAGVLGNDPAGVQSFWRSESGELVQDKKAIDQYAKAAADNPRGVPHVDNAKGRK